MIERTSIVPDNSTPPDARPPRVLLVEGSSVLGDTLRDPLEQGGCQLHVWSEQGPVLEVLRVIAPDLILVDINMNEGSAFELCGEIRATDLGRQVPILLVAPSELDEQVVARGLLCGADDVIAANRHSVEIQARIRVQLRNKRDRDRLTRLRAERDTYQLEAKLDALTGIPNRRAFDARITAACQSASSFSLLFFDIDHFKRINDTLGHDVGDKVLAAVAECLYKNKRKGDVVARYGGEEFVLLLPTTDIADALTQAERHRRAIEQLAVLPHIRAGQLTASVGVAPRKNDLDPAAICRRADEALYAAKHRGRNCVVLASSHSMCDVSSVEAFILAQLSTNRAGLPLLPEAAQEALRVAEDPRTDISRIAKLVERDPGLAARFVALASSAAYSGRVRPATTTAALVRIGLHTARDLLLQIVYERIHDELPMFRQEVSRSFARSVKCALAARQLAKLIAPGYDLAYLCGLLHDIGEARIYRICSTFPDPKSMHGKVDDLVRRHHERAGAQVARAWHLPDDIVVACETHHDGSLVHARVPVRIVRGADALVRLAEGPDVHDGALDADTEVLAQLGVEGAMLGLTIDAVRRLFEAIVS